MLVVQEGEDVYVTETIYNKETGKPVFQRTMLNGMLQSPPDGSPSEIGYDEQGRTTHIEWHDKGEESRLEGPSSIIMNPDNGIHKTEVFKIGGEPRPSSQGPWRIFRNDKSGQIINQNFADDPAPQDPEV